MPRGGKRPGAGRKKGSVNKQTRQRRAQIKEAAERGVSPLDVMLEAMRHHHEAGDLDAAAKVAQAAAPYVHPRLGAVTVKGDPAQPIRLIEELVIVDGNANPSS